MNWSVNTRDDSPSQGKPKFFICYYENDRKEVAQRISCMFLKLRNCAVYYSIDSKEESDPGETTDALMQVQAVVFPVYSKRLFLLGHVKTELDFCRKNHIPILPILMDDAESAAFFQEYQNLFGNIQLLMPESRDETKIPFYDVLEQHLENIITDDSESYNDYQREGAFPRETNVMIRSAFRGSLFLSYRKSDRRLVKQIIEKIHADPDLTDIMLWYDEYLIPGEDYNDILEKQILDSDVFLILGTESALVKNNYILTHEYPKAKTTGKRMLLYCPEEDLQSRCRQCFSETEIVTMTGTQNSLAAVLKRFFRNSRSKLDDRPSEKIYLLGKAYLEGKLTETNRMLGVRLIEQAAGLGFVSAMRLMAHLYQTGTGVGIDPDKQSEWLERAAVAAAKESEEPQKRARSLHDIINLSWQQGDIRLRQMDFEGAYRCYETMLDAARQLRAFDTEGLNFSTYEAMAFNKLANTCTYLGRNGEARSHLEQALIIFGTLPAASVRPGGGLDYAETLMMLANLDRNEKKLTEALSKYKRALDAAQPSAVYVYSSRAYMLKCDILESMGVIGVELGDCESAEKYFEEELRLAQSFCSEFEDIQAALFGSCACRRLGDLYYSADDLRKAADYYIKAVEYAKKYCREEKTVSSEQVLCGCSISAARVLYLLKDCSAAKALLSDVDRLNNQYEEQSEHKSALVSLSEAIETYELLGNIAYNEKRPAYSRVCYQRMTRYCTEIYNREHTIQNLTKLASAYYKIITSNPYILDFKANDLSVKNYEILRGQVYNEKNDTLYRKSLKIMQDSMERRTMNRKKVANWAALLLEKASLLEQHGVRYADDISNQDRIIVDILELVLHLAGTDAQINSDLLKMLNYVLETNLTVNEVERHLFMIRLFGPETEKSLVQKIPESIQFLTKLESLMQGSVKDYHDGLAFMLWIVMYVVGDWALDLMKCGKERAEMLLMYMDQINLYIEEELS